MLYPRRIQPGFSFPELLVALGLSTVLISTLIPLYRHWNIHLKNLRNRIGVVRQGVTATGYLLEAVQDFWLSPQFEGAFRCLKPVQEQTARRASFTWLEPQPDVGGYLRESVDESAKRIAIMPIGKMKPQFQGLLWDRRAGSCAIVQGSWTGSSLIHLHFGRFRGERIHSGAYVVEVREHRYDLKKERFYRVERGHAVPFFGREVRCRHQTPGVLCQSEKDRMKSGEPWFVAFPGISRVGSE